ncbi:unnamed protein product [Prunus armeniaca]
MELKWVVDIWCRLFKHSVEELDLRGESFLAILKRRRGRGKLLRRWAMAKMVVELKRINRGKKEVGKKLLAWVEGGKELGFLGSWGLGWRVVVGWVWVESGCGMGLGVGA